MYVGKSNSVKRRVNSSGVFRLGLSTRVSYRVDEIGRLLPTAFVAEGLGTRDLINASLASAAPSACVEQRREACMDSRCEGIQICDHPRDQRLHPRAARPARGV